jgi:hypothetical protein
VLAVAAANAGTLRELRSSGGESRSFVLRQPRELEALLRAAPQLRILVVDLYAG